MALRRPDPGGAGPSSRRILVVDDNEEAGFDPDLTKPVHFERVQAVPSDLPLTDRDSGKRLVIDAARLTAAGTAVRDTPAALWFSRIHADYVSHRVCHTLAPSHSRSWPIPCSAHSVRTSKFPGSV